MNIKKSLLTMVMAAMIGLTTTTAKAEELNISGDIGVFSQYVWRGMVQGSAGSSVQGDLGADIVDGLSANVWFATPIGAGANSTTEFDWTIDYSGEVEGISYSAGYIYYSYLNGSAGNTGEAYASLGYGPVSVAYYYATNSNKGGWKKGSYLSADIGTSVKGFDLGATIGFYFGKADTATSVNVYPTTKKGLGHVDLSISKDVTISDVTMTPSLMVSIPTWKDAITNKRPTNGNLVVAGVNFAY
jgi:uncharacterized protein (TIGR02001 family)